MKQHQLDVVRCLLQSVHVKYGKRRQTPLIWAITKGDMELIQLIIKFGDLTKEGYFAWHRTPMWPTYVILKRGISYFHEMYFYCDIDRAYRYWWNESSFRLIFWTPLLVALQHKVSNEILDIVIDHCASIDLLNLQTPERCDLLTMAITEGKYSVVIRLVKMAEELNIPFYKWGIDAILHSSTVYHSSGTWQPMVDMMLMHGAEVDISENRNTPLLISILYRHEEWAMKFIMNHNCNVNVCYEPYMEEEDIPHPILAIQLAIHYRLTSVVRAMIQVGCDLKLIVLKVRMLEQERHNETDELWDLVQMALITVSSLKHLSRIRVRKNIGTPFCKKLSQISREEIPQSLIDYIAFKDDILEIVR